MYGYTGRILYVDLTGQTFRIENFDEAFAKKFLGGNGFAAKILYDGLKKGVEPFSAENLVVFRRGAGHGFSPAQQQPGLRGHQIPSERPFLRLHLRRPVRHHPEADGV
jgi:aldehyde:ferredoxin oxidoreductase